MRPRHLMSSAPSSRTAPAIDKTRPSVRCPPGCSARRGSASSSSSLPHRSVSRVILSYASGSWRSARRPSPRPATAEPMTTPQREPDPGAEGDPQSERVISPASRRFRCLLALRHDALLRCVSVSARTASSSAPSSGSTWFAGLAFPFRARPSSRVCRHVRPKRPMRPSRRLRRFGRRDQGSPWGDRPVANRTDATDRLGPHRQSCQLCQFCRVVRFVHAASRDPRQEARDVVRGQQPLVVRRHDSISDDARVIPSCSSPPPAPKPHAAAPSLFVTGLSAGSRDASPGACRARFTWESLVDRRGVEPLTSAVQTQHLTC